MNANVNVPDEDLFYHPRSLTADILPQRPIDAFGSRREKICLVSVLSVFLIVGRHGVFADCGSSGFRVGKVPRYRNVHLLVLVHVKTTDFPAKLRGYLLALLAAIHSTPR